MALVLACALLACPGARPDATAIRTTTSDGTAPDRTAADPPPDDVTERVVAWAQGTIDRGPRPRGSNMRLLAVPAGQPIARGVPRSPCVRATSFLPGPPRDPRIFLLVDRRLVAQEPGSADAASTPGRTVELAMPGSFPSMRVERLLAFSRSGLPLELLVTAQPDARAPARLWVLTIGDAAVSHARPAEPAAVGSREAFFARFDAPRCKHGDRRCLRIGTLDGETSLYEQPVAGESQRPLQTLGKVDVRDAAWAPAARAGQGRTQDGTLYLLTRCTAE